MITITRFDHRKARPGCYSCPKESDYKLLVNRDGGTSSWNIGTALCLCDECLELLYQTILPNRKFKLHFSDPLRDAELRAEELRKERNERTGDNPRSDICS